MDDLPTAESPRRIILASMGPFDRPRLSREPVAPPRDDDVDMRTPFASEAAAPEELEPPPPQQLPFFFCCWAAESVEAAADDFKDID